MEPVTLSQIFDDQLFNDISENLLDDIDVSDFSFDLSTFLDSPEIKNLDNGVLSHQSSEKTTLGSLLKCMPVSDTIATHTELQSVGGIGGQEDHNKQRFMREFTSLDRSNITQAKSSSQACAPIQNTSDVPVMSKLLCDSELQNFDAKRTWCDPNKAYSVQHSSPHMGFQKAHFTICKSEKNIKVNTKQSEENEPMKRAPHNAIEKRYRASINGKIDELRRLLAPNSSGDVKMNKSAVLRRAIDRIRELEEVNAQLNSELMAFRSCNHTSSYIDSNQSTSENETHSLETSPVSLTNQEINDYYYRCKTSPHTVPPECLPVNQLFHFTAKSIQPTNVTYKTNTNDHHHHNNNKGVVFMKMKEYSDSFHSSSSSPSSSSPPSINSPFNFQSSYDKKFNANSQHSSLSPPFSGIGSSFLLHQNTDSYEIVNGMNYEGQLQTYHLSSHSLVQSPNIQASYRLPPPPPLIPTPHSTIILPEQPVLIKGGYYHKGHRKRLAEDSNMELFTPTKARCDHLLVNNRGCGVKRVAAPQTKEAMNIISDTWNTNNSGTSIQAQFPNVCQLLCESNSCSHSLPKPIKTSISDKNQCIQPGVGFNEAVARTTLCVAALCLIALNPAQITNQMSWSTPKMEKLSTSRSLLYYFDPSGAIGMPNSWFISFMYCLQWFIALILCSWACHRKQISFQLFNWSRHGNKIISVHKAKSHYRQANMAISQLTWSIADYHLKLCLHSLGSSTYCELTQSVHTTSHIRCWYLCLRSIIASIMNLLTILFIYLPYWVWMYYFRKFNGFTVNTSKQVNSTTEHKISSPEVRLRLMELYLFDYKPKNVNPYNSRLVKFFQSLDDLSLGLMCTRDFLDASTHGLCDYKMIEPVGSVSTSEYNFVDNNDKLFIHLLPRQGITLGLFLKRKLGMDYLGSLIIRMTIYVTMRFDLSQLWRTWFSNVLFVKLITGDEKLNFGAALSSTTTTTSSMREYSSTKDASLVNYPEKNIITQLLIELREHITCHCLKIILYGEINQVKSLQCYIHLLIELSPSWNTYNSNKNKLIINGEIDDKEYEETNDQVSRAHWWAQMLNILWQYRCDQIKLPLQSSLDEEDQIKLMESDPTHCCTPQSLISCSYLGDLVKVLSVINNFNSLDNKTSFHMSLQSVYSSLRSLAKSCRNLNNSHTGMGSTVKSNPQFDYMRFNFLAWSLVATNWFIDVLTVKLKSMKSCKMKETTDISMVLLANGFTDSVYLLRQLIDDYFNMPTLNWFRIKLQNAEAVHRMLVGASPIRARFALLQNHSLSRLPKLVTVNIKEEEEDTIKSVNDNCVTKATDKRQPLLHYHDNHVNGVSMPAIICRPTPRNGIMLQSPGC